MGVGPFLEDAHAVLEERRVAAKLVDGEAAEQRALFGGQQAGRAENRCEDAAAFDVRDEDPRRADACHQSEIHEVELAKVELADAAGAFDHHDIEAGREILVRGQDMGPQFIDVLEVAAGGKRLPDASVDHDLARARAVRLEQDRVHRRLGFEPARFRLHDLRAADLSALPAGVRVVRHVLSLERRDGNAVASQPGAQSRGHPALAGIRRRAPDEDRPGRHQVRRRISQMR